MRLNSKELKKHFYSIPELAAKWGCDEKDIIHLAISREIFLSINLTQYSLPNISGWWNIWHPGEVATLLTGDDVFYVSFFQNPADDNNPEKFTTLRRYDDVTRRAFEFSRSEVVVRGRYVEKFELNHPEKFLNDPPAELHQPHFHEKPIATTAPVAAPPNTARTEKQPAKSQEGLAAGADVDHKSLPGAMEKVLGHAKLCKAFAYGENSFSAVSKKVKEYTKRFPDDPIHFKRIGQTPYLYNYEAWKIIAKLGNCSRNRTKKETSKKT